MIKLNHSKGACSFLALLFACSMTHAQDADFDLSSQRSESQDVLPVPGEKMNHHGIVLNPTPHKIQLKDNGNIDLTGAFCYKGKDKSFMSNLNFLSIGKKGVNLSIEVGEKASQKKEVKTLSGAYALTVSNKSINITGYDKRGVFYAIQTLKQLKECDAFKNGKLPYLEINDYPDLKWRGVVEGFYGTPWSHEVRLSLIDFYGRYKLNTYIYGPKDDPYHSSPNWRLPYPDKEAENIKELINACNRNYVDFVWAIHPGQDIKWNEEDYNNLVNKFNLMYDLGVRAFAVFFDDINGEGTNPEKQTELLNRLTNDFVKVKGDVSSMIVCPTDYSKLWANPTEQGALAIYGRTLDPSTEVFWTGDVVCSDLTKQTLNWVNSRIKRPAYFWWNYPVTDYARQFVLQGPVYGLDTALTSEDVCGFASNPMEYGEASKLALYGVSDYTWNVGAYNAIDNWERGLAAMVPGAPDAYRTFAIHSSDTENGYRRDESWETKTFNLAHYSAEDANNLYNEFDKITHVPLQMQQHCPSPLLSELKPWLTEFGKLGERGKRTLNLMKAYRSNSDYAAFWSEYLANCMSKEDYKLYNLHKSGTMKLQPFYEDAMDDMAYGYMEKLLGYKPMCYKGIASFNTAKTTQTKLMFDNDSTTYYTSGISQQEGDWIGVDLGTEIEIKNIHILQGRNSVDDVDYFDHAVLECSDNGKDWHTLIDDMKKQYIIDWVGSPVKARYVRLRRLSSEKKNYASVRTFEINKEQHKSIVLPTDDYNHANDVTEALDKRLDTFYRCNGAVALPIEKATKSCLLLLGNIKDDKIVVKQLNKKGKLLDEVEVSNPFKEIAINKATTAMLIEGDVDIYEIISK